MENDNAPIQLHIEVNVSKVIDNEDYRLLQVMITRIIQNDLPVGIINFITTLFKNLELNNEKIKNMNTLHIMNLITEEAKRQTYYEK